MEVGISAKLSENFSPTVPPFAATISRVAADVQAPDGESGNVWRRGKTTANYPQDLAQDAVCQSHTGHKTGLWFLPARPLRLNTNEWMKCRRYGNFVVFFSSAKISGFPELWYLVNARKLTKFEERKLCIEDPYNDTDDKRRVCETVYSRVSEKLRKYIGADGRYFEHFRCSIEIFCSYSSTDMYPPVWSEFFAAL